MLKCALKSCDLYQIPPSILNECFDCWISLTNLLNSYFLVSSHNVPHQLLSHKSFDHNEIRYWFVVVQTTNLSFISDSLLKHWKTCPMHIFSYTDYLQ